METRTDEHQVVPISESELRRLREIAERFRWIIENVTYLEHKVDGKEPKDVKHGGYFPQSADDLAGAAVPELVGIDLDEYLKAVSINKPEGA